MKGVVFAFLTTLAALPAVQFVGQIGVPEHTMIKELGVGSAQMVLSCVACTLGYTIFKMFQLWRRDVDQAREESKESAELLRGVVRENSVALVSLNTSSQEVKSSVYHLSSVIANCDEVRKIATAKKDQKHHED